MNGRGSVNATSPYLWVAGIPRPDHGADMFQLACDACGAGWVGRDGEPCWWCERSLALLLEHQARLLIQAPDVDPADARWAAVMADWRERLRRGVQAELISRNQAERAWEGATRAQAA